MKKIINFLVYICIIFSFGFLSQTNAGIFSGDNTEIPYCNGNDCGLEQGVDEIGNSGIQGPITQGTGSEYVQKIIVYVLTFLKLIAIILIIYAGFNMLTSAGDEDKAKKSKTIIVFTIIGLLIIYLAGPITTFVIDLLSANPTP